jgi:hypothetical protein
LWTALTGGVGKSKTWVLDNGKYGFGTGPLAYADPTKTQTWRSYAFNWDPADVGQTANDMAAQMTFSLIGGPFLKTVKPNESGNESGTFFLNADGHTLSTTDATIIRPAGFIGNVTNWNTNLNILELTEDLLRIAVYRTNSEGPWWYVLSFVSKEHAETYVPEAVPDPNFNFGDQLQILAGNSATTWKIHQQTPFNWTDLNGVYLNNWYAAADYPGWTGFSPAAVADFDNARITFTRTGDVTVVKDDGTTQLGSFALDQAKNMITFEGVKPSFYISGGWVTATTTDYFEDAGGNVITGDNQWKIIKTRVVAGVTTEVWFGKRDPAKKEYMVFHFILASGIPDMKKEMIKGLTGKATGESSRSFKIDTKWPVDWTNPEGTGWTVSGVQADWYWSAAVAASVKNQSLTFKQVNGVVTVTKVDEQGNTTTSPVTIDGDNQMIIINDIDIIKFGAGSGLPTTGPAYKWVRGDFSKVATDGLWIGVLSKPLEYTAYHYILQ